MTDGARVTLKQVAERAGVSRTTASYVLAGRDDAMRISTEAAARVLRAAEQLDYRPNLTARSLRTSVTGTIGFVSDMIVSDESAGQLVSGAMAAARERGRVLLVGETQGATDVEGRVVRDLLGRQVDGLVMATVNPRPLRLPRAVRGTPLVMLNCWLFESSAPALVPAELEGGVSAARVLLDEGHRRGIWIVGELAPHLYAGRERVAGVRRELAGAGVALAGVVDCQWWPSAARHATAELLASGTVPHAVVCLNDRVALGVYQALAAAGLEVPGDVSVVSFDGSELSGWLHPGLTTVALPLAEMGRRAVELLVDPAGPSPGVQHVPMPLQRRCSVGPPRTGRPAVGGGW